MIQRLLQAITVPLVYAMRPIKLFAYRTRFKTLQRFIIEITESIDFALNWVHGQNEIMVLNQRVFGGPFIFGKGVMITDHAAMAAALPEPSTRSNRFMGIHVVSNAPEAFATNAPMISQNEPLRTILRQYLDREVFTDRVRGLDYDGLKEECAVVLDEWRADPKMSDIVVMRSAVTRMFLKVLSGVLITKEDSEAVTWAYLRRFVELSLLERYFPFVTGVLGTKKYIRADAYFKLKQYGIDVTIIDMTLFAAMFSVGTLVIRCVTDIERHGIDYEALDEAGKVRFILEAVRLYPTVTTTHTILEKPTTVRVCNKDIALTPGDEVTYPLVCAHHDPKAFADPLRMDLERPQQEVDNILSWSAGPHMCPARDLSILVTRLALDTLAAKQPLSKIGYTGALI